MIAVPRLQPANDYVPNDMYLGDVVREVRDLRTETSKTWQLTGDRRALVVAREPIHRIENNEWVEHDFRPQDRDGWFRIRIHQALVLVSKEAGPPTVVVRHDSGKRVRVQLTHVGSNAVAAVAPQIECDQIVWRDLGPYTHMVLTPRGRKASLWRHLMGPSAPKQFRWLIEADSGVNHSDLLKFEGYDAQDNRLQIETRSVSDVQQRLVGGEVIDYKRTLVEETWTGKSSHLLSGGHGRLRGWRDAVYPVRIDPSVSVSVTTGNDDASCVYDQNLITASVNLAATIGYVGMWKKVSKTTFQNTTFAHQGNTLTSYPVPYSSSYTQVLSTSTNTIYNTLKYYSLGAAFSPTLPAGANVTAATFSIYQLGLPANYGGNSTWNVSLRCHKSTGTAGWAVTQRIKSQGTTGFNTLRSFTPNVNPAWKSFNVLNIVESALGGTGPLTGGFSDRLKIAFYVAGFQNASPTVAVPPGYITGSEKASFALYEHATAPAPKLTIVYTGGAEPRAWRRIQVGRR